MRQQLNVTVKDMSVSLIEERILTGLSQCKPMRDVAEDIFALFGIMHEGSPITCNP